jgi:hypothetical protein
MKKMVLFLAMFLVMTGLAFAQQDPQDPGIQDSLIIDEVTIDSGTTFAFVRIYAVTDDSVAYYNLPLSWTAPYPGVSVGTQTQYFFPLTSWDDVFDTVMTDQSYVRQFGFADLFGEDNPYLHTNGQRVNAWTLRFIISPSIHRQLVVLDTTWDDRSGSVILGLSDGTSEITPGFKGGFLGIGVGVDDDNISRPLQFSLSQNYPNPFNPETNIEFSLPSEQNVNLMVFNLLGQQVRTLVNSSLGVGTHTVIWDGKNDDGINVPSGIYFYKMFTPEFSQTNKMVMVR